MVLEAIGYKTCTSLDRIDSNLNADRQIIDILCSQVMPYLSSLKANFQKDNARSHVAHGALNFLDIQGCHLLP